MRKNIITIFLYFILITFFITGLISAISGIINFIDFYTDGLHTFSIKTISSLGEYITPAGILFTISLISATILTVLKQQESNKLQREEFEYNKIDAKKELFVNHFFQLLKIYENIISSLEYKNIELFDYETRVQNKINNIFKETHEVIYYKRGVFNIVYEDLKGILDSKFKQSFKKGDNISRNFKNIYSEFYSKNQEYIGHYYRTIYQIMKLIDNNKIILTKEERLFYSGILRAQLSTYELLLLYYNGLSEQGEKLKQYVLDYSLLKHLDLMLLNGIKLEGLWELYEGKI